MNFYFEIQGLSRTFKARANPAEIIVSSCILHNICIIEDDIDDFLDDSNDDDDNDDNDDDIFPPGVGAVDKRNMIMRLIP